MLSILRYKDKFQSLSVTKKNSIFHTGTSYIEAAIRFVQSFILAKILGPTLMGEVASVTLIMTYGTYLQLGTYPAMVQKLPLLRSRKEFELANKYKNTAFTFSILIGGLGFIGLSLFALIADLTEFYKIGFILQGASIPLYFLFLFYTGILRCENKFDSSSIFILLLSVITLIVSLGLVFFISNKSVLVAMVVAYIITNLYAYKNRIEWFKFEIDFDILKHLIKLGIPLIAVNMFYILLNSADKIVIIKFLDSTQMGLYSFPVGLAAFYFMGGRAVSQVLYRKAVFEFGQSENEANVLKTLIPGALLLVLVSPLIGFCIEGGAFFMIDNFLPKYTESKEIFKILIPACVFMTITSFLTRSLVTVGSQVNILYVQVLLIIYAFSANIIAIHYFNAGINGITIATASSYFFYFALLTFANALKFGKQEVMKIFFTILIKVITIFAVVILIQYFGQLFMQYSIQSPLKLEGVFYSAFSLSVYCLILLIFFKFDSFQVKFIGSRIL